MAERGCAVPQRHAARVLAAAPPCARRSAPSLCCPAAMIPKRRYHPRHRGADGWS